MKSWRSCEELCTLAGAIFILLSETSYQQVNNTLSDFLLCCAKLESGVAGCAIIIYGSFCTKPSFVAHREVSSGVYVLVKIFRWWKFRVKVQEPFWKLREYFGGAHSSSQRWGEKSASRRLILQSLREDPQTGRGWKGRVHMVKRRG